MCSGPAFLCRPDDLIITAAGSVAKHGGAVNIKENRFLAPEDTRNVAWLRCTKSGCETAILTRTRFDFRLQQPGRRYRGIETMRQYAPVMFR